MSITKFQSRKFLLAAFFAAMGTLGLFTGKLTEGSYVALVTIILGLYGGANVLSKNKPTSTRKVSTSND